MDYFSKMNEEYIQKHFPDGSVFQGAMKKVKGNSILGIIFFGLFFAGGLFGLIWGIQKTLQFQSDGEEDMLSVGIVICAVFGVFALICLLLLIFLIRGILKKRSDYIADSAKHSKLPVSEIETFEKQAAAPDCFILKLTKGLDRVLSNATNKDGLLTRDYIYLADPAQTVMRVDSLRGCFFTDYTYSVQSQTIHNLAVCLVADNGVSVLSDTTQEAGEALMALLRERNSAIDTNEGKVVSEKAFDRYKKQLLGNR